ncbi:MAG: hypothetical protein K2Q22_11505, partial [Cytophagales bacterium]|nr:hypothetical protein [Cytophagales bacterium]
MAKGLESSWIKGIRILLAFCIFCAMFFAVSGLIFATFFYYMPYSEKVKTILTHTNNEHLIDVFSETPKRVNKLNTIISVVAIFNMLLFALSLFLFKIKKHISDKCV